MNLMVSPNPLLTRKQVNVHNCPHNSNKTRVNFNFPREIIQLNQDKFKRHTQSAFRDKKKGKIDVDSWFGWKAQIPSCSSPLYIFTKLNVDTSQLCNNKNFSATLCSLCVISQLGPGETLCLVSSLTDTDTGAASPQLSEK